MNYRQVKIDQLKNFKKRSMALSQKRSNLMKKVDKVDEEIEELNHEIDLSFGVSHGKLLTAFGLIETILALTGD